MTPNQFRRPEPAAAGNSQHPHLKPQPLTLEPFILGHPCYKVRNDQVAASRSPQTPAIPPSAKGPNLQSMAGSPHCANLSFRAWFYGLTFKVRTVSSGKGDVNISKPEPYTLQMLRNSASLNPWSTNCLATRTDSASRGTLTLAVVFLQLTNRGTSMLIGFHLLCRWWLH